MPQMLHEDASPGSVDQSENVANPSSHEKTAAPGFSETFPM